MSPDLRLTLCPHCGGDGGFIADGAPGAFSARLETFLPSETATLCPHCLGEGVLEVCAHCHEPLELRDGHEVCACSAATLGQAA